MKAIGIEPILPSPSLDQVKMLVVEDDAILRDLLEHILASEGAEVKFAKNGQEAIEMAAQGPFDIVLMDLSLPQVSGEEAMQRIKQSGIAIPIVALSAHRESEKMNHCLEKGFDDYISKPFELGTFIYKIKANLEKRTKMQSEITS